MGQGAFDVITADAQVNASDNVLLMDCSFRLRHHGASFDEATSSWHRQMDSPSAIARNVGHEPPLGGLVVSGHAGGFASMLQRVAIGATWGQKSRQCGRQDLRQNPTSTSQGPWNGQKEPWNRQNGPNGAGYGSNSGAGLFGGSGRSGFFTEVGSLSHSRARKWASGNGDIGALVARQNTPIQGRTDESRQPLAYAEPGWQPHPRDMAKEQKGRKRANAGRQNGRARNPLRKVGNRGRRSFLKKLEGVGPGSQALEQAIKNLEDGFYADSSKGGRESRCQKVLEIARRVACGDPFPLTRHTVVATAACLKLAKLVSADQYLGVLKCMHVEEGYGMSEHLSRVFAQCKRSLKRDRGPENRAPEYRIDKIEKAWLNWRCKGNQGIQKPVLAYVWAAHWMLREIELRECLIRDILLNEEEKQVTLTIRKSKTDQSAAGTRRTLKCVCQPCTGETECVWSMALLALKAGRGRDPDEPLFVTNQGNKTTKATMVAAWNKLLMSGIRGHSPRRSGAMRYVRAGLQIQELAFLGRWRSAAVLRYAEEALREMPTNGRLEQPLARTSLETLEKLPEDPVEKKDQASVPKNTAVKQEDEPLVMENTEELVGRSEKTLFVKATTRTPFRPAHLVTMANWRVPMASWTTACGWKFAANPSGFKFVIEVTTDMHKCSKCKIAAEVRDEVREVPEWRTHMPNVGK